MLDPSLEIPDSYSDGDSIAGVRLSARDHFDLNAFIELALSISLTSDRREEHRRQFTQQIDRPHLQRRRRAMRKEDSMHSCKASMSLTAGARILESLTFL
jgi:hypothetical protein